MDRRNWMRLAVASMALAVGAVVVAPGLARAEIPQYVQDWLDDKYGAGGWQDGGHNAGPPHSHIIIDPGPPQVRLGSVIESPPGTWTFEEFSTGNTYPIPAPVAANAKAL